MALLFIDGFDHYVTADITKKWTSSSGSAPAISTNGRRGGGNFQNNTNGVSGTQGYISKGLPASIATGVVGFALYLPDIPTSDGTGVFLSFLDTSVIHVLIGVDAAGALVAYRATSSTVLGRSTSGLISAGSYNFIEVKTTISDTVGIVTVRLNGVSVLTLTGQDTRNSGNATFNTVRIGQFNAGGGAAFRFDDMYVLDTSGSTNNDFLGDVRVDTLYPTSDGNYTAFTPSTGSTHYTLVDETTPNTTDYNDGAAVNDRDSYGMGNLSALASQTVYGVQVNAAILKDDAGSKSAATFVRSSGTDGDGASTALSTSQMYVSQVFETDPNGSIAWTESSVNAMEAGVRVTA